MADHGPILVTGAGGQLGSQVVEALRRAGSRVVAGVRTLPGPAALADLGVEVRVADYERPETLRAALDGIARVLLVSSNALGRRVAQHRAVVEAAVAAGVELLAYTSVLHADASPLGVAEEHRQTEALIRASGLPYAILRNGWYTENYLMGLPDAVARGSLFGGAGEGRIASAARADYAAAAAAVLTAPDAAGRTSELAGDEAYSLAELAAEAAKRSGRAVAYVDLPEVEYRQALVGAGLPEPLAELIAQSDACARDGALFDDGRQLSRLIGRPTTPLATSIAAALGR